jgi:hypothetical protein
LLVMLSHGSGWQHDPSKQVLVPQAFGSQLIVSPVQGSLYVPQVFAGQVVAGVQHVPASPSMQTCPPVQLFEQSSGFPVHGSITEPQKPSAQVSGVQQLVPLAAEHICPDAQLSAQLMVSLAQVSFSVPQKPGAQVGFAQQKFGSPPPFAPHSSPDGHGLLQVKVTPLHGSLYVPAHCPAGQPVAATQQLSFVVTLHIWAMPASVVGHVQSSVVLVHSS